jgi:hypothetical protein
LALPWNPLAEEVAEEWAAELSGVDRVAAEVEEALGEAWMRDRATGDIRLRSV